MSGGSASALRGFASASRKRSDEVGLTIFALWVAQVGLIIRGIGQEEDLVRQGGRLAIDVAALMLMIAGVKAFASTKTRGAFRWIAIVIWVSVWCAVSALAHSETILINWVLVGVLPFGTALAAFVMARPDAGKRLERALVWQLAVGVVYGAGVLLIAPPSNRVEWNGVNGDGPAKIAARTLYALPFLLGHLDRYRRWEVVLVGAAVIEWLLLAVTGASRGMFVTVAVLFPVLGAAIAIRRGALRITLSRGIAAVVVVMTLLLGLAAWTGDAERAFGFIEERAAETIGRLTWTDMGDVSLATASTGALEATTDEFIGEGGRAGELRSFVDQLTLSDVLIGRGFGATWRSTFWGGEWTIVHFGPAHLVLLGGVPLLVAFIGGLLTALWLGWKNMRVSTSAGAAFCFLVVYLESFLQHGVPGDDPAFYLVWLSMGLAFASARDPKASAAARLSTVSTI